MKKASDLFVTWDGVEVDLNDPELYLEGEEYKGTPEELRGKCLKEIGYAHMYTHYFWPPTERHPDMWKSQWSRIDKLCKEFAAGQRAHRFEDSEENRLWFKKWMYRFADEIENMC